MRKKDFAGIVSMESKELLEALKQKKLPKEVKKELTHTLAAILRAGVRWPRKSSPSLWRVKR